MMRQLYPKGFTVSQHLPLFPDEPVFESATMPDLSW
jgi:hypothetical protein